MARNTRTVRIVDAGRDQGKTFFLTEMSAASAEDWAVRAFLALAKSGAEIPDDVEAAGMLGVATMGLKALGGVTIEEARPLMEELMGCIEAIPDPARPEIRRPLVDDDTEEVATRIFLRKEVLTLHVDFTKVAALLDSKKKPATKTEGADSLAT